MWHNIRSLLFGGIQQRITRSGLLFSGVIVLVGLAAFASANNLLFLLLAAMLATLLLSGFVSRLSLAGLEMDFRIPEHVTARSTTVAGVLVRNTKRMMPSFSIHLAGSKESALSTTLYFPVIPSRATLEETVEIYFGRRGTHRENSFHFWTRFPFGFAERRIRVVLQREVLVYPCLDPQPGFEDMLTSLTGDLEAYYRGRGSDFYRIRPYEALESARHVDWRATAHTGDLQVREFAREQEHLVQIVLDLGVSEQASAWFDRAVDCCAFLAWRLAGRGARLRFRTQEFDLAVPEEGDIYTILKYLALVQRQPGAGAIALDDETSFLVVFSMDAGRLADIGWAHAHIVGADDLAVGRTATNPGTTAAGTDPHLDHRHREDQRRGARGDQRPG